MDTTSIRPEYKRKREKSFPSPLLADQLFHPRSHTVRAAELANASLPILVCCQLRAWHESANLRKIDRMGEMWMISLPSLAPISFRSLRWGMKGINTSRASPGKRRLQLFFRPKGRGISPCFPGTRSGVEPSSCFHSAHFVGESTTDQGAAVRSANCKASSTPLGESDTNKRAYCSALRKPESTISFNWARKGS